MEFLQNCSKTFTIVSFVCICILEFTKLLKCHFLTASYILMGTTGISVRFWLCLATSNSFLKYSTVLRIPSRNDTYSDSRIPLKLLHTINGERFAGPNFHGFEEDRESFSVNILHECLLNNYRYNIPMNCKSISAKYFIGSKPRKFSPAKLSLSTVDLLKVLLLSMAVQNPIMNGMKTPTKTVPFGASLYSYYWFPVEVFLGFLNVWFSFARVILYWGQVDYLRCSS